jgi:hypothetical protein
MSTVASRVDYPSGADAERSMDSSGTRLWRASLSLSGR